MPSYKLSNFVETQNIARFKALLVAEQHPDKRQILIQLLADEEAKQEARIATNR